VQGAAVFPCTVLASVHAQQQFNMAAAHLHVQTAASNAHALCGAVVLFSAGSTLSRSTCRPFACIHVCHVLQGAVPMLQLLAADQRFR
jgi:microcystin-dependent protein